MTDPVSHPFFHPLMGLLAVATTRARIEGGSPGCPPIVANEASSLAFLAGWAALQRLRPGLAQRYVSQPQQEEGARLLLARGPTLVYDAAASPDNLRRWWQRAEKLAGDVARYPYQPHHDSLLWLLLDLDKLELMHWQAAKLDVPGLPYRSWQEGETRCEQWLDQQVPGLLRADVGDRNGVLRKEGEDLLLPDLAVTEPGLFATTSKYARLRLMAQQAWAVAGLRPASAGC